MIAAVSIVVIFQFACYIFIRICDYFNNEVNSNYTDIQKKTLFIPEGQFRTYRAERSPKTSGRIKSVLITITIPKQIILKKSNTNINRAKYTNYLFHLMHSANAVESKHEHHAVCGKTLQFTNFSVLQSHSRRLR